MRAELLVHAIALWEWHAPARYGRKLGIIIYMTTMEIVYRYAKAPSESVALALNGICDVYGIRGIKFDRTAQTICVGYDASRLNAATVTRLVHQAGLEIAEVVSLIPPQPPALEPETAAAPS